MPPIERSKKRKEDLKNTKAFFKLHGQFIKDLHKEGKSLEQIVELIKKDLKVDNIIRKQVKDFIDNKVKDEKNPLQRVKINTRKYNPEQAKKIINDSDLLGVRALARLNAKRNFKPSTVGEISGVRNRYKNKK